MKPPVLSGFDQSAFYKYFKNTAWLLFGKILSMLLGLIIARYLGPSYFGELNFAIAFTALFMALGTLGLDSFIVKELIHHPKKNYEILGTTFWMRIGVNLLLLPLCVLAYALLYKDFFFSETSTGILIAICSFVYLFRSFQVIDSYFQSQVKSKFVVQAQNICVCFSALIKALLMVFQFPVIYFAIALVLDACMLAIGLLIAYRSQGQHIDQWQFSCQRAQILFRKSWPLMLTALMITLYMQIDQVMLEPLGSKTVGIYSAAARISEAWYFIPVAIVTSVFPAIIYARQTDTNRYQKRLQNLYDLLVAISLPIAVIISLSSNFIISCLYGNQYEGAGIMLSIHIWSGVFVFLGSASGQYLVAEGYTRISFMRTALGALINILLNIWLIPLYAGVGASIATLAAYFVASFSILLFPKSRQQGWMMLKSLFLISFVQKIIK